MAASQAGEGSEITLGSDPEFLLVNEAGRPMNAAHHIIRRNGKFGTDGCASTAELRPDPALEPWDAAENVRKVLVLGARTYPEAARFAWRAGSAYREHPTGGHLHFGHRDFDVRSESPAVDPLQLISETVEARRARGMALSRARQHKVKVMGRLLDTHLAPLVMLMEDPREARARRGGTPRSYLSYGHLGDVRTDVAHGFEYRTLPSFIATPATTLCVFALAKLLVEHARTGGYQIERVPFAGLTSDEFMACDKAKVLREFSERWRAIKAMRGYERYEDALRAFRWMLKQGALFSQMPDMKLAWEIEEARPRERMRPEAAWEAVA